MKLVLFSILGIYGLLALAPASYAQTNPPRPTSVGTCSFAATVEITSVHWVWGGSGGDGEGAMTCTFTDGSAESLKIAVHIWGFGVGFGVTSSKVSITATDIKITGHRMRGLLGDFMTTQATQPNQGGNGKMIQFTATRGSDVIPLAVHVIDGGGLEVAVSIGGISIEEAL